MPRLYGTASSNNRTRFYYSLTTLQAVRKGRWKLVLPRQKNALELSWLGRYTEDVADYQLYDLERDLSEKNDVARLHPNVVTDLLKEVEWATQHH
jgi:arylsulfatase